MSSLEIITLVVRGSIDLLAIYFLFILFKGDNKFRWQAGIIVIYCLICSLIPDIDKENPNYTSIWIQQCSVIILINGAAALSMLATTFFGKNHRILSLIFLFAAFINGAMLTILEGKATEIIYFIRFLHPYYGYLILLTYIMMIGVSYDGFTTAFNRACRQLQRYLHPTDVRHNNFYKNFFEKEDFTKEKRR